MAIDPRSIIGAILSRRPDLQREYAPRLRGMGFPLPNVPPAGGLSYTGVMTGDQLGPLAKYAGRTPAAPPAPGLTPDEMAIPFGGTGGDPNSLRSMADRGDPGQAPDFRSRLADARMMQGSAAPRPIAPGGIGSDVGAAGTNPTAQVSGQLPGNLMSPGNLPRPRPFESPIAARLGGPPGGLPAAPLMGGRPFTGSPGMASRFGDQSQLAGGAFSGSLPRPPQARPFESMIAGRPMPPGGPGSLPAAPLLAGQPFTGSPGMASRFGDNSQLASGAFSGGRPRPQEGPGPDLADFNQPPAVVPPVAAPSPIQPNSSVATRGGYQPAPGFDQAMGGVPPSTSQMAAATRGIPSPAAALQALPQSPAASVGPPPPLSPAALTDRFNAAPSISIDPRMAAAASLRAGRAPAATIDIPRTPDITAGPRLPRVRPEIAGQALPPPDAISSIPPASIQSLSAYTGNEAPIVGQAVPSASPAPVIPGTRAVRAIRNMVTGDNRQPVAPVNAPAQPPAEEAPRWTAPKIGMGAGTIVGAKVAGPAGALIGAGAGWGLGRIVKAMRARGQNVDAQGNILDKAGNIIGHVSQGIGNAFGNRGGNSMPGGSWGSNSGGGWGGPGGWGGGSSYTGGSYGGNAGGNIGSGVGQRFGQR